MSHHANHAELETWFCFSQDPRLNWSQRYEWLSSGRTPTEYFEQFGRHNWSSQQQALFGSIQAFSAQSDCACLPLSHHKYPPLLKEISRPPLLLFCRGDLSLLQKPAIAVVGSRRPSQHGMSALRSILEPLAKARMGVISGLALGIDALAHEIALQHNAPTIAVLANGINVVYPAKHRSLQERIASDNLLLSEFAPDVRAAKHHFIERNRIVSGLSLGVLVVEAADKSGTMITARWGVEQNRDVFVIPGSILNPQYAGSHRLLQQGALLVQNAEDIALAIGQPFIAQAGSINQFKEVIASVPHAERVLKALADQTLCIDELVASLSLTPAQINSALSQLELADIVVRTDGLKFALHTTCV